MKKLYACALLLAVSFALSVAATSPSNGNTRAVDNSPSAAVGNTVADFKLPDAKGAEHSLSKLRGPKGTILIFVSVQCPVSNAYNARMEKLAQELKARGVNVVGINSNVAETPEAMAQHAAEKSLTFTMLKDKDNKIADRLGALVTPEAYFLDASNKLVYRGRIDNSRNGDSISSTELRDAVEATLAGKPVEKTEAKAFGCSIKRVS